VRGAPTPARLGWGFALQPIALRAVPHPLAAAVSAMIAASYARKSTEGRIS